MHLHINFVSIFMFIIIVDLYSLSNVSETDYIVYFACICVFINSAVYTGMFQCVLVYASIQWYVLVCTGMCQCTLVCSSVYWYMLVYTSMFQYVLNNCTRGQQRDLFPRGRLLTGRNELVTDAKRRSLVYPSRSIVYPEGQQTLLLIKRAVIKYFITPT